MFVAIFGFIVLIALLVLFHEWGHFWVARRLKIKVEEFGFGFPPKVFGVKKNGILYTFNLLPIGGFVKIFGEQGEGEGDPESFTSRPVWQRLAVIIAGVVMNVILAWALFSLGSFLGVPTALDDGDAGPDVVNAAVTIIDISADSPAAKAGIQFGDVIERLKTDREEKVVDVVDDIQQFTAAQTGSDMTVFIRRGSEHKSFTLVPRANPPEGEGPIGVALSRVGILKTPWYKAPWVGLKQTGFALYAIVAGIMALFADLLKTGKVAADVSGPVGIFRVAGQAWTLGISYFLQLAAVLSVNLAVLNAFPFPALDGGRMLFLVIEKIRGSKVDQRIEQTIHTIGFIFLILLMVAITYRDVVKLF